MRNNVFVVTDDLITEVDVILASVSGAALYTEDPSVAFSFGTSYLNVLLGSIHRTLIETNGISVLQRNFNTDSKTEVNFGLRMFGQLQPTVSLIQTAHDGMVAGDRIFFVTRTDNTETFTYYKNQYDIYNSDLDNRRNFIKRKRIFNLNDYSETLTHAEIEESLVTAINVTDALFSTMGAPAEKLDFDASLISSGTSATSGSTSLVCRVLTKV